MKIEIGTMLLTLFMVLFAVTTASASEAKAVDSKESYTMVMASPTNTFIIDVRTKAEYIFVGHPDMANGVANIPLKFFPEWKTNTDFVDKVAERHKKSDKLIMMCRSGGRAKIAANILSKAGFTNTLYMTDSFEGSTDKNGHRNVNGWKVNNLPYTYKLEPDLTYK